MLNLALADEPPSAMLQQAYSSPYDAYQVEQFKTTDGNKTLSTTQNAFANLVQAMAGITPGSGATSLAEVTMLQNQRDALNLALNAVPSWQ